jgi:hypothetical protein
LNMSHGLPATSAVGAVRGGGRSDGERTVEHACPPPAPGAVPGRPRPAGVVRAPRRPLPGRRRGQPRIRSWLLDHGCRPVEVAASQATSLPFGGGSFDAALVIGVLGQLVSPDLAALELRRVLRPGGMVLSPPPTSPAGVTAWTGPPGPPTGRGAGSAPSTCGACCSWAGSAWSGWRARTAPSCGTCPLPGGCATGAGRGLPGRRAPVPRCSGRRSGRSPSRSEAPVVLVLGPVRGPQHPRWPKSPTTTNLSEYPFNLFQSGNRCR